jgi:glyoxylase-like metal-dependent hydrolase (beta-lactamase superfamily II)
MIKKILFALIGLLFLFFVALGVILAPLVLGNAPLEHNRVFAKGRVSTVMDGFVSCSLVDAGEAGWILIDACGDPEGKAIKEVLADKGGNPEEIRLILLTHGHYDHTAGIAAFPDAEVRVLKAELPLLRGEVASRGPLTALLGKKASGIEIKRPLGHGDVVHHGDTSVRVFAMPGHTAGSAAFLAHGVVFFGDSAGANKDGTLKAAPWVFTDDMDENGRSLVGLYNALVGEKVEVKSLIFGHSGPLDGLAPFKAFNP